MNINQLFLSSIFRLKNGDLSVIDNNMIKIINTEIETVLEEKTHNQDQILSMQLILDISNILCNNTDIEKLQLEDEVYDFLLELEDGLYDILLEEYRKYNSSYG
ncbi:MAG: hypothetical protein M0P49_00645 [Bacilli bacterium]|nr:hypothetical protein [Bacilli bacterium]